MRMRTLPFATFVSTLFRKMMGEVSQGMLLSAEDSATGKLRLLTVDQADDVAPGSEVG